MRNVADKSCREVKTYFMFCNFFFPPPEDCAVYEIRWKSIVELGMPQKTIWRMHIAWWTTKAIKTHTEYLIFIAFTWQQWLHKRTSPSLIRILPGVSLFSENESVQLLVLESAS